MLYRCDMPKAEDAKWWSEKVREARGKQNLDAFAVALGVAAKTIWRWENGTVPSRMGKQLLRQRFPAVFGEEPAS